MDQLRDCGVGFRVKNVRSDRFRGFIRRFQGEINSFNGALREINDGQIKINKNNRTGERT
jgi:hypothetical protein